MPTKTKLLLMGLCAGIIFNLEASATSLIVEGGKLTGATGIQLGSSFYDVEFLDGSCENLFNGCNSLNDFLFNETMAIAAAEALRDEVFIGLYDTNPELTRGVTDSARGNIITPYGFHVDPWTGYIKAQGFTNISADGIDSVYLGAVAPGWDTGGASALSANYTYARWTQADPIIDLEDVIIGLQVITGNETSVLYESWMDVNDDGKIGLEETIYALQVMADLKPDNDGDGYTENQGDCNDGDASINPGANEICGDGIDQDCAGGDELCQNDIDNDGDGYTENQGDASINPGAYEICGDGIDQDCNGSDLNCNNGASIVGTWCATRIDGSPLVITCDVSTFTFDSNGTYSWFLHALPYYYLDDNGTYSYENQIITFIGDVSQLPADGYIEFAEGSNSFTFLDEDGDRWIYERSDCAGGDELCQSDIDNDGDGYTENQGDCNDDDASINPGANEICGDGIDQDCAGGDAQCGGVGNCEVVTSGPSTLTIINDRNVGVSTDFQGAAFGSDIRPFKCEIYGYSGITRVDFIQCNFIGDTCYENTFGQTVTVNISDGMTIRTSNLF